MISSIYRNYYADLGLQVGASPTSIKAAFHALARQHHPDKSGTTDTSAFRKAREAYEKLSAATYLPIYNRESKKPQSDTDEEPVYTRTAQYEAEEKAKSRSPPPRKPFRKVGEPNWAYYSSNAYQTWQKKDEEYNARHPERKEKQYENQPPQSGCTAHGLRVQMSSHPAAKQQCTCRTQHWKVQPCGVDYCVFCMEPHTGGSRCPGCEALACSKCLHELVVLERNVFDGLGSKSQYRASGG